MQTRPLKVCVIVNPIAGKGRAKMAAETLKLELEESPEIRYEIWQSGEAKEPVRLAQKACLSGFNAVVAVGGDGTLSDVVNGILTAQVAALPKLGVLPAGTGNDFARGARLVTDRITASRQLVKALLSNRYRCVDVLRLKDPTGFDLFAINSVGIGFDAAVARSVKETQVNKTLGHLSYAYSVFHCLRTFKRFPLAISARLSRDTASFNHRFDKCWFAACTNTQRLGGGIRINPDAIPDDGEFDICVGHSVPPVVLVLLLPLAFFGGHRRAQGVAFIRSPEALIDFPAATPVHVDGDPIELNSPLRLSVLPAAIHLLDTTQK
ncbi:MAG TPA: diacylglycerol kinase family lipid kinase [Firmicutes bacterium]|nr:diacylglycerol kinase family lipid kinase [Bacillota bacterium]